MIRLLIISVFVFISVLSYAQGQDKAAHKKYKIDTIWASSEAKTYLIFPHKVEWADVGIAKYVTKPNNKTLFVIAAEENVEPASIVIKFGDDVFHGTIAYTKTLAAENQVVNFNEVEVQMSTEFVNKKRVENDKSESLIRKLVDRRMGIMEGYSKDEEKTIAVYQDKMMFKVSIMRQDGDMYYFKLDLYNKSKIEYRLDYVDFVYKDVDNGGITTKNVVVPVKIYEFNKQEGEDMIVESKGQVSIYAAVKRHAVGTDGWLEITAREKDGMRGLTFKVDEKYLADIEMFSTQNN